MNLEELTVILNRGEDTRTEFKTSFNDEAIVTLVAFSNTKGGTVYIGIGDTGSVTGVQLSRETTVKWINEIKGKTAPALIPDLEIIETGDKKVVAMSISEYPVKPVSTRGRYYKRVGNSNHILSVSEVVNFHLKSVNSSWDFYLRENKTLDDISFEKVQKAIETINRRNPLAIADDPLTFLRKFQLIAGESITHACWLLFMPDMDVTTTVELGHFASETVIKDSLTLHNDLFSEVAEIMDFIRKHISKKVIFNGELENEQRWDYPLEALRELVINMVLHRDYTSAYDSVVKIFADRIEFYNPGAMPPEITLQRLLSNDYISQPRNKLMAEIFKAAGLIEKYGSGIKRVMAALEAHGLPKPEFQLFADGFRVKVFAASTAKGAYRLGDRLGDALGEPHDYPLGDNQHKILEAMRNTPTISLSQLSKMIGISQTAVENNIAKLKKNGLINREGSAKRGMWIVNKIEQSNNRTIEQSKYE